MKILEIDMQLKLEFREASHWAIPQGAPVFKPERWSAIPWSTNCYSYALNLIQKPWAKPGDLTKKDNVKWGDDEFTVERIRDRLLTDGLIVTEKPEAVDVNRHIFAAFLAPGRDFHFYRLDQNGGWSHKTSTLAVTDEDFYGAKITDPESAFRGEYSELVGFYEVPPQGIPFAWSLTS